MIAIAGLETLRGVELAPREMQRLDRGDHVVLVRPMEPRPIRIEDRWEWRPPGSVYHEVAGAWLPSSTWLAGREPSQTGAAGIVQFCPYGLAGERLKVREEWSPDHAAFYPHFPIVYRSGFPVFDWEIEDGRVYSPESDSWHPFAWRPASEMPDHFVRHVIEVHSVAAKQGRLLTEGEALGAGCFSRSYRDGRGVEPAIVELRRSLQQTYGAGWDLNAWVWSVLARRVEA